MSTNTQNYNLVKPAEDDEYDIGVYNGNMDKMDEKIYGIESSLGDVRNYSFGVKSDINLTSEDVILQEVDYCKGLIVIATAHDTNALILPNTDNHKYTIYNADENTPALIKKPSGRSIEIAPKTMVMVGYDGVDYRMIVGGGGASDATRFKPSAIDSAVDDLTVVGWDKDTNMWKAMQNGYMLYFDGYLYSNGSRIPVTGFEGDDGLVAFVDENGTLTSDGTKVQAGYIVEDGDSLLLDLKGDLGIAKEYTANMQTAYTVIGKSQTARIKSEMPADADGYYLCYKSVAWVDGDDENTGTRVGDFTQNYIGDDVWYTVEGLQDNNTYHFKWFPYKGDVVNRTIGQNEDYIFVQAGVAFWNFNNIEGNTILDSFNAYNLTNLDCPYVPGDIGTACSFTGASLINRTPVFTPDIFTINVWITTGDLSKYLYIGDESINNSGTYRGWQIRIRNLANVPQIGVWTAYGSISSKYFTPLLSANTKYMITVEIGKTGRYAKLHLNGVYIEQISLDVTANMSLTNYFRIGYSGVGTEYSGAMVVDQYMIIEGSMPSTTTAKLWNGGLAC